MRFGFCTGARIRALIDCSLAVHMQTWTAQEPVVRVLDCVVYCTASSFIHKCVAETGPWRVTALQPTVIRRRSFAEVMLSSLTGGRVLVKVLPHTPPSNSPELLSPRFYGMTGIEY